MSLKQNIEKVLRENLGNAHMAGQHDAGCPHSSWANACGDTKQMLEDSTTQILTLIQKEKDKRVEKTLKQIEHGLHWLENDYPSGVISVKEVIYNLKKYKQTLTGESNE